MCMWVGDSGSYAENGLEEHMLCLWQGVHDGECEPGIPMWALCLNSAPLSRRPALCFHLSGPGATAPQAAAEPLRSILAIWLCFFLPALVL